MGTLLLDRALTPPLALALGLFFSSAAASLVCLFFSEKRPEGELLLGLSTAAD